jgi:hypothetical protein
MKNLKVDLRKRTVYFKGRRTYWWKIKHERSTSSEEGTDIRAWFTDSKKHAHLIDENGSRAERVAIREIERLEKKRGELDGPIDWLPAEHQITTPEKLEPLNKFVDRAEKEHAHSRRERERGRSMKPPSIKRISKTKYEIDWGKNVYRQKTAYDRLMNEITVWHRREHGDDAWHPESHEGILQLLDEVIAEFKESESGTRKSSEQKEPASRKNPEMPSKQKNPKRPAFAERNKHGGLIIHSLANRKYYTRFDIGKSKKYPGGFTFRMNRGKFYILETLDRESLAAIEKEISWVLRS